jgi:two-component system nitrate/nitrite response regulator NarL
VQRVVSTALISSDSLLSNGLVHILRSAHYRLSAIARSFAELRISAKNQPEMLILVPSDDPVHSAEIVAHLRRSLQSAKIVVLSERDDPGICAEILRAGAVAYLPRSMSKDAFVKSLDLVMAGEVVIPSELLVPMLATRDNRVVPGPIHRERHDARSFDEIATRLSCREADILECLVDGESNKHIGRRFDIAETTVKVHIKSILRKINASNRTQAAIWALNHGIGRPIKIAAPIGAELDEEPPSKLNGKAKNLNGTEGSAGYEIRCDGATQPSSPTQNTRAGGSSRAPHGSRSAPLAR